MDTYIQTTNEDEHLHNKLAKTAKFGIHKLDGIKQRVGVTSENPISEKLSFGIDVKESPFNKFQLSAGTRGLLHIYSDPGFKNSLQGPDDQELPPEAKKIHSSEGLVQKNSSVPQSRKKQPGLTKVFKTYPKGILKKKLKSKYSLNFEKYINTDKLCFDPNFTDDLDKCPEPEEIFQNKKENANDANSGCTVETNYTCGDDEEEIYKDASSLFNTRQTSVRAFASMPGLRTPFEK